MGNRAYLAGLTAIVLILGTLGLGIPMLQALGGEQQPAQSSTSAADRAAPIARARRACQALCDTEHGQCNSEVRRSRQECSRQAAAGTDNPFLGRPDELDFYCGYFDIAECETAGCAARFAQRYAECVQFMRGNVASRRFDCIRAETKAQALCRAELRDCRAQCE